MRLSSRFRSSRVRVARASISTRYRPWDREAGAHLGCEQSRRLTLDRSLVSRRGATGTQADSRPSCRLASIRAARSPAAIDFFNTSQIPPFQDTYGHRRDRADAD